MRRIASKFKPILFGWTLSVQWMIDSFLRVEGNNLNWMRMNQKKIKAE